MRAVYDEGGKRVLPVGGTALAKANPQLAAEVGAVLGGTMLGAWQPPACCACCCPRAAAADHAPHPTPHLDLCR